MIKPSILPGMMELLPEEQIIFNEIKDTIEETFKKYGFLPLDTPVMEKQEILFAKGGGETSKQVYAFEKGSAQIGLRYDLTVPLARYVAQYFSELVFPFRRYHIAKVYRGERNQRGRYREFYQCDIDIVGHESLSLYNDAEIPAVMNEVFVKLGFENFKFLFNNRKLLNGFFQSLGLQDFVFALRTIDKIDKIGIDKVEEEFIKYGIDKEAIKDLLDFISVKGTNEEIIRYLENLEISDELFLQGLDELKSVYENMKSLGIKDKNIQIQLSITRGLDYYTGSVYETVLTGYESIGSICSGGRYEDLAANYSKQKLPGVGMSIGLTRLFYQLNEANLLNKIKPHITDCLIIPMKGFESKGIELLTKLRKNDKMVQIYLEGGKLKKQFNYADKLNVPYAIVIGEEEVSTNTYSLKNMETGEQIRVNFDELIKYI
ncbi:MAG: histidine--tRNA ligase [Lagierella massiliensis]|nr:histidine--tRNA ligase [Lagierella massiliensis]